MQSIRPGFALIVFIILSGLFKEIEMFSIAFAFSVCAATLFVSLMLDYLGPKLFLDPKDFQAVDTRYNTRRWGQ